MCFEEKKVYVFVLNKNEVHVFVLVYPRPPIPFTQSTIKLSSYLDSHGHERPAFAADVASLTTRPHIIVVRQINIKHKLALHRKKGLTRTCLVVERRTKHAVRNIGHLPAAAKGL